MIRLLPILFMVCVLSSCGRSGSPLIPSSSASTDEQAKSSKVASDNVRRTLILNNLIDTPAISRTIP